MTYIGIFAAAVPTDKREAYLDHARAAAVVFKQYGALEVIECWGADTPDGEVTSFPKAVQCGPDETVAVGWVVWPDRETHDAAMPKVMADPTLQAMEMPFDGKRLIFGGFERMLRL
jgi:uncharacterized protein YbaA (DUF1428 family)